MLRPRIAPLLLLLLLNPPASGAAFGADALGLPVPGVLRVLASADEMPEVFSFEVRPATPGFERELVEGFTRAQRLQLLTLRISPAKSTLLVKCFSEDALVLLRRARKESS